MNKKSPIPFEALLDFSTNRGRVVLSVFGIGILAIIIKGMNHLSPTPVGDEYFYIQFAQNISKNGIFHEIVCGNPVGYTLILNLFSRLGFNILTAGRLLSMISTIAVFTGLWVIGEKYFNLSNGIYLWLKKDYLKK